ncbi:hypothetical protein JZ751_007180, partial [Albula glossodonta]
MAVSWLSATTKHLEKIRTLATKNCRALVGPYSSRAAEQCSTGNNCHGSDTKDNHTHSVTEVRLLEARACKLEEQVRDLTERYSRALADSDTVRRRTQKFVEDAKLFGIQSFCRDLVEVADLLELVAQELEAEGEGGAGERCRGLALAQDRLQAVFSKHGLEKMSPEGGRYDPYQHEIVCHMPAGGAEPGTITLVKQAGYQLHGRTIRHAHVGIA